MTVIKAEICNLYKKSYAKFSEENLNEIENDNVEDYNDHDYVDNLETIELEPAVKTDKVKEIKKKSKKVTISEIPAEIKVGFSYFNIHICFNFRKIKYCINHLFFRLK